DASDTNNFSPKLTIPLRIPRPASAFEARVWGPFLVIRSLEPTRTPRRFLEESRAVELAGQSIYIGDADVNLDTAKRALKRLGAGGQAANVAAWAVELGAEARFVGKRGGDEAGRLAAAELEQRGVEVAGPVAPERNGVVVSLVEPGGDRTMASDRGVAPSLRAEELDPAWFADSDWLHLAGYSLLASP